MVVAEKNRLIIAAAGSGKTTLLVSEAIAHRAEHVLITTFTQANEAEIRSKFIEQVGFIPPNVTIQTIFSLFIQHGAKPYLNTVLPGEIKGLELVNQQSVPWCKEADNPVKFYLNSRGQVYSDKLAKLVYRCNEASKGHVIDRLSRVFDRIYFDEAQDLAGYDLEIVKLLFATPAKVVLVGDPRQAVYATHFEQMNKKYRGGMIEDYVRDRCRNISVHVDKTSLSFSYRSNRKICELSDRLYPDMPKTESRQDITTGHDGVFEVKECDVDEYLATFKPLQLRHSSTRSVSPSYPVLTFGKAKGLTVDRVLIYATRPFWEWFQRNKSIEDKSRSDAYVALTRARYSVGIVPPASTKSR